MEKIRKGDEVVVLTGKDRGRRGTVLRRVDERSVLVEGVNRVKKHQRPNPMKGQQGGIVEKEMPIDASNVMLWNAKASKGDRVGFRFEGEGAKRKKVRFFKSNQELVD